jgi:phosphoglycolate phosphatase
VDAAPRTDQQPDRLLLFDVDGTLLRTHGGTTAAMTRAARDVFRNDFTFEGVDTLGGLDPLILQAALTMNGVQTDAEGVERFKQRYLEVAPDDVELFRRMPGVPELLGELRKQKKYALGLLTGNYRESTMFKLKSIDLKPDWFPIGAFGEDAPTRPGLFPVAAERAEKHFGRSFSPDQILIIGDTLRDVDCALANKARCLAVATGVVPVETLRDGGAHVVLENFADTAQTLESIDRLLA